MLWIVCIVLGVLWNLLQSAKNSSSDATSVALSGLGCAAWWLGVYCQVIKENQRSLECMALGGKCDPTKRKRSGRGSRECMAPSSVR